MGVIHGVKCTDCNANAPELGDCGTCGLPSLSTRLRVGWRQNFGFMFRGFRAIEIVTAEHVAFLQFLRKHEGHRFLIWADDDEETFRAKTFKPAERDPSRPFRGALEKLRGELDGFERFVGRQRFVEDRYELSCPTCDDTLRTENPDYLLPFAKTVLSKPHIQVFLNTVVGYEDNTYRASPFEGDIFHIGIFLKTHANHEPTASLAKKVLKKPRVAKHK